MPSISSSRVIGISAPLLLMRLIIGHRNPNNSHWISSSIALHISALLPWLSLIVNSLPIRFSYALLFLDGLLCASSFFIAAISLRSHLVAGTSEFPAQVLSCSPHSASAQSLPGILRTPTSNFYPAKARFHFAVIKNLGSIEPSIGEAPSGHFAV